MESDKNFESPRKDRLQYTKPVVNTESALERQVLGTCVPNVTGVKGCSILG